MTASSLDWPRGTRRTPPDERRETSKFETGFRRTESELKDEMRLMDVETWALDYVTGSGVDPGIVLWWHDPTSGEPRTVACDAYTNKSDNLREIYKWVNETRMREQRRVATPGDAFAAAALPPGDEPSENGDGPDYDLDVAPHALLGVPEDASDTAVREAARDAILTHHPDQSDDDDAHEYVKRIKAAKDAIVD